MRVILSILLFLTAASGQRRQRAQDTGCKKESQCSDEAFCHKTSHLCVCNNGASTYPMCHPPDYNSNNTCSNCLDENTACDSKSGKCMCKFGGMRPNCCTSKCGRFKTCYKGRCFCMYGSRGKKRCQRCEEKCKKNQKCVRRGTTYTCQCRYGLYKGKCKKKPTEATTTVPSVPKCPGTGKTKFLELPGTNSQEAFFEATCKGGCIKIDMAAYCCSHTPWRCKKKNKIIQDICEGQETCKFRLAPSLFKAECPEATIKISYSCNNGELTEKHTPLECVGDRVFTQFRPANSWLGVNVGCTGETTNTGCSSIANPTKMFKGTCQGGCVHIVSVSHTCYNQNELNNNDVAAIRSECEGKEQCIYVNNFDKKCNGNWQTLVYWVCYKGGTYKYMV